MSSQNLFVTVDPDSVSIAPSLPAEVSQTLTALKTLIMAVNHNLQVAIGQIHNNTADLATANNSFKTMMVASPRWKGKSKPWRILSLLWLVPSRRPKLNLPEKFDGSNKDKAVSFRVAVSHYLRVSYPQASVEEQIAFIISCLEGKAHEWLEPYLEEDVVNNHPVAWLHSINGFWLQFNARWNVQNKTENYRAKFKTLKQTKSVQDYYKDFQTYSQNLGYNDISLRDFFYDGLSLKIKEMLMAQDYDHNASNVSLENLADKALKIDPRLEQFQAQHKGQTKLLFQKGTTSSTGALGNVTRDKLTVGDKVYMIGPDGKARKGTISKIGKNAKGMSIPTVKWNDGTVVESSFKSLKKDSHPVDPSPVQPKSSNSGPSPMDLDSAGKGKKPIVCSTCGGKGHYASQCPSNTYSGYEAHLSENESENGDL
ncbi:Transposon Tf2-7 polyprotein [Rhizoctonia solani]|uniref:Transposon Tf2-7 polyprotein n=1 Tax=Rhizoctonia solani TaxID=456999 RepID=A0A8H8PCZ0_9AGAM|nr:Transposon Tf2-7 polyprotein [Rhizoctonia solani]QRW27803.1 Transposon Tf2-7 polyprotein [Rhizoctonia solani]